MKALSKIIHYLEVKRTSLTVPFISSQIQQLPDIITDGGVVTRAMWNSINTCQKIQQVIFISLVIRADKIILAINYYQYYSHFLFSIYE